MTKRNLFNSALLSIILIASLIILLDDTKNTQTNRVQHKVSDLSSDDISTIRIERTEQPAMEFHLENGEWMMTIPYRIKASNHRIKSILALPASRSKHQLAVKDIDLNLLGLTQPKIRLHLNDEWFEFGITNPLDEQRYLLHQDTVHLIHDTLYPQLNTHATFFVESQLLRNNSNITSIQYPDGIIQKNIRGEWIYTGNNELNSDVLKERIINWQSLSASHIQEASALSPLSSITLHFMNGEQTRIHVISETPHLILHKPGSPVEYRISPFIAASLFPPVTSAKQSIEQ